MAQSDRPYIPTVEEARTLEGRLDRVEKALGLTGDRPGNTPQKPIIRQFRVTADGDKGDYVEAEKLLGDASKVHRVAKALDDRGDDTAKSEGDIVIAAAMPTGVRSYNKDTSKVEVLKDDDDRVLRWLEISPAPQPPLFFRNLKVFEHTGSAEEWTIPKEATGLIMVELYAGGSPGVGGSDATNESTETADSHSHDVVVGGAGGDGGDASPMARLVAALAPGITTTVDVGDAAKRTSFTSADLSDPDNYTHIELRSDVLSTDPLSGNMGKNGLWLGAWSGDRGESGSSGEVGSGGSGGRGGRAFQPSKFFKGADDTFFEALGSLENAGEGGKGGSGASSVGGTPGTGQDGKPGGALIYY